jgi:type VI secretion system protein ImpI
MALHLKIENETTLPDGGPVSITVSGKRGIDIGRDAHLDWTLPDPTRYISSKHAEIRYRDGAYWLHDVSTNGTLLNGADHRMQAPHRLRDGDRFTIGHYIIAVALDGEPGEPRPAAPAAAPRVADYQDIWDNLPNVAPPIDREQLKAPRDRAAPVDPDFLDWAADVPNPGSIGSPPASMPPPLAEDDMNWSAGPKSPGPPPPPVPPNLPAPRRPRKSEAMAQWGAEPREAVTPFERPSAQSAAPEPTSTGTAVEMPDAFLQRLAQAAEMPEDLLARKDPGQLADELGAMLRIMVEGLMQLLSARRQARLVARSSRHTVIQAFDNNPLKFSPNVQEALRTMFGPPTRGYLDPLQAIQRGFEDLKRHEIKTYSAMQHALAAFVSELDPKSIEQSTQADSGISALVSSRKAKLWDLYVARWQAQMIGEGNGAIDRFMLLFAEYYDRDNV